MAHLVQWAKKVSLEIRALLVLPVLWVLLARPVRKVLPVSGARLVRLANPVLLALLARKDRRAKRALRERTVDP